MVSLQKECFSKRMRYQDGKEHDGCCLSKPDTELCVGTPLPLEWQQCLDIRSGEMYFYNTKTRKRTFRDPRLIPTPPRPCLSLDLKLKIDPAVTDDDEFRCNPRSSRGSASRSLPWISLDADRREMVATVCMRCHMLVMMCKAALSCPNCKFVHPPYPSLRHVNEATSRA
ncbi:unnamed protein product [Musa acuminata subsp. burmannicoides]